MDTLAERRWSEKDNGELLDLAEQEAYEVLVTTDRSMRLQNMIGRRIGIVVLLSANWPLIRLRTPDIHRAIAAVRPGEIVEVLTRTS